MRVSEFVGKYHDYNTASKEAAEKEAAQLDVEGHEIEVVSFDGVLYCLVLDETADELRSLGLLEESCQT